MKDQTYHRRRIPLKALGLASIFLLSAMANGIFSMESREPTQQQFVSGEWIVKFQPTSAIELSLNQLDLKDILGNAEVTAYMDNLSRKLDVPVQTRQVTSGREFVLAANRKALVDLLIKRLTHEACIKKVYKAQERRGVLGSVDTQAVVVELVDGSDAEKRLAMAYSHPHNKVDILEKLAADLSEYSGYKLRSQLMSNRRIAVSIDFAALTQVVLERLKKHKDVKYAQLNFISQIPRPLTLE